MNNILRERAIALSHAFTQFSKYNFNKELAEELVKRGFNKNDNSFLDEAINLGMSRMHINPNFKVDNGKIPDWVNKLDF